MTAAFQSTLTLDQAVNLTTDSYPQALEAALAMKPEAKLALYNEIRDAVESGYSAGLRAQAAEQSDVQPGQKLALAGYLALHLVPDIEDLSGGPHREAAVTGLLFYTLAQGGDFQKPYAGAQWYPSRTLGVPPLETNRVIDRLLGVGESGGDGLSDLSRARLDIQAGVMCFNMGLFDDGIIRIERALRIEGIPPEERASAFRQIGFQHRNNGDLNAALRCFDRGVAEAEKIEPYTGELPRDMYIDSNWVKDALPANRERVFTDLNLKKEEIASIEPGLIAQIQGDPSGPLSHGLNLYADGIFLLQYGSEKGWQAIYDAAERALPYEHEAGYGHFNAGLNKILAGYGAFLLRKGSPLQCLDRVIQGRASLELSGRQDLRSYFRTIDRIVEEITPEIR